MLAPGAKITVYTAEKVELGEGTFLRKTEHADLGMTAYECREHTILAKGRHYLKIGSGRPEVVIPEYSR